MDLQNHSWLLVLAVLLAGGLALFWTLDILHPSGGPALEAGPLSGAGTSVPSGLSSNSSAALSYKASHFPRMPAWSSYEGVINGPKGDSLSSDDLKGHVALVDFWTYSCINCIRTLPYIESWQQRYGPQGFLVVEFHSPEFDFEKNRANVQAAVQRFNLSTITVLDGEHRIWDAFGNNYWPHVYLIDADGFVRYDHVGEGGYDETEKEIRALLAEQNASSPMPSVSSPALSPIDSVDFSQVGTPELYFGGESRRAPLGDSPSVVVPGSPASYLVPASLSINTIYLNGTWADDGQDLRLVSSDGDILLTYRAKAVHLVADAMSGTSSAQVFLDSAPYSGPEADSSGSISIGPSRLYTMVLTPGYETHTVRIHVTGAGMRAYSFTFG